MLLYGFGFRLFSMAGDFLLYRYVLGYPLVTAKWKKGIAALCGFIYFLIPLFWSSFSIQLGIFISSLNLYFDVSLYILSFILMLVWIFLFQDLKAGVIFFIFVVKFIFSCFIEKCFVLIQYILNSNSLNVELPQYAGLVAILFYFLLICGALHLTKKKKLYMREYIMRVKERYYWIGGMLLYLIVSPVFLFFVPEENWNVIMLKDIMICFAVLFLMIVLTAFFLKKQQLKEEIILNYRCIQEQTEQYKRLAEKQQELRHFRHDLNGHILVLQQMIAKKQYDKLGEYLGELEAKKEKTKYVVTGNIIGDAILNNYYQMGEKDQVKINVLGTFPPKMEIAETDLCIILTNMISNAYEASLKCEKNRFVNVEISRYDNNVYICIRNPIGEKLILRDGILKTTKKNKEFHGLGIQSAMKAAERNHGWIRWEIQQDQVITKIEIK